MFKKNKQRKTHFIIFAFLIGLFMGINVSFFASASASTHTYLDYFHRVYQLIRTDYVEETDSKKVFYGAIKGMIKSLDDPFSSFLDKSAYSELKSIMTSKYVGVGIEIMVRNGKVVVVAPLDGTPAMASGVKSGDIIMKVNGTVLRNKNFDDIVNLIKGKADTTVTLSVKRAGVNDLLELSMKRMSIKINSVDYAIMDDKTTGYIKIKVFNSETTKDVTAALNELNNQKIQKLILDLRNNPGGALIAAEGVSDLFLDKGQTIVTVKGRKDSGVYRKALSTRDSLYKGKLIVLINNGSASASEILAGAIRDNKRGILVGEKSFGKASVQKSYELDPQDKVGVKITIAKYYTPSGEMIHGKGINPDHVITHDKLSKHDGEMLKEIYNQKLLDSFVTDSMNYDDQSKKAFQEYLAKHKITLSANLMHLILKRRIEMYRKKPVYDLEFDEQLVAAVKLLKKD